MRTPHFTIRPEVQTIYGGMREVEKEGYIHNEQITLKRLVLIVELESRYRYEFTDGASLEKFCRAVLDV